MSKADGIDSPFMVRTGVEQLAGGYLPEFDQAFEFAVTGHQQAAVIGELAADIDGALWQGMKHGAGFGIEQFNVIAIVDGQGVAVG